MNIWFRNGEIIDLEDVKVRYSGPYILRFKGFRGNIEEPINNICKMLDSYYGIIYTRDSETIYILDDCFNMNTYLRPEIEKDFGYHVNYPHPESRSILEIESRRSYLLFKDSKKRALA